MEVVKIEYFISTKSHFVSKEDIRKKMHDAKFVLVEPTYKIKSVSGIKCIESWNTLNVERV